MNIRDKKTCTYIWTLYYNNKELTHYATEKSAREDVEELKRIFPTTDKSKYKIKQYILWDKPIMNDTKI